MLTWQEFTADTDPANPSSVWKIVSIAHSDTTTVFFVSSSNRIYSFEFNTNLAPAGWSVFPGQSNRPGTGSLETFVDTLSTGRYYRVRVFGP